MRLHAEQPEASLRESELKYRMLAENSPLAIQILAPDGTTSSVNPAWERLWGVPFSAVRRHNVLQDPQLAEKGILPLLRKAFAGECVELPIHQYDKGLAKHVANSSGKLWLRVFAYPSYGPDGALREVVLVQEDVTERVLAEKEIRNLAYFDPLTQLPNRRLLTDRLGQALVASQRTRALPSKPPIHSVTTASRIQAGRSSGVKSEPRIAAQAPTGASPSVKPRMKWESQVKRLVKE